MDRSITPALVEEAACTVKVVKVILIRLASEEVHVCNLEITPKVTRREPLSTFVVCWSPLVICEPFDGAVLMKVVWMIGKELNSLGPQGRQGFGFVIQRNGEAVGLVVVLHVSEYIIVDIAKEVNFRFDTPIPSNVFERWVFVKHAAIPSAHLMV